MRFEYHRDEVGRWRWRLVGGAAIEIARGGGYATKLECLRAIDLVRAADLTTPTVEAPDAKAARFASGGFDALRRP